MIFCYMQECSLIKRDLNVTLILIRKKGNEKRITTKSNIEILDFSRYAYIFVYKTFIFSALTLDTIQM